MQLDCSSCHLNYAVDSLRAEEINADGHTMRSGFVREVRGYLSIDIDDEGEPKPGASKVDFTCDYPAKDGGAPVTGGWSLRLFVFANEPQESHARWATASKDELLAQVRAARAGRSRHHTCRCGHGAPARACSVSIDLPALQVKTYKNFKHEKTMLQWLALEHGHRVIYGVRFHCECAVVEAMWAYLVSEIREELDGTAATLFAALVNQLAFAVKPEIAGRLFNRPTEAWLLYSLGVCLQASKGSLPPGTAEIFIGLLAVDVLAIQRAFSGYGNKKAMGSSHARASLAGARADAMVNEDDDDDVDPLIAGDVHAAAPPRAVAVAAAGPPPAPGGAAAGAAAASAAGPPLAPLVAAGAPFVSAPLPPEVPDNLWELLSCVKEPARRALLDKRRAKPAVYGFFVDAVQRAWNSEAGRGALRFLADKTRREMTPVFALRHACVLAMRVRVAWPEEGGGGGGAAAAAPEPVPA